MARTGAYNISMAILAIVKTILPAPVWTNTDIGRKGRSLEGSYTEIGRKSDEFMARTGCI